MRVLVIHQAVDATSSLDDADVLEQAEWVVSGLRALGLETEVVACDLDLRPLLERCQSWRPDAAFNLVECLGGSDRLAFLAPALVETLGIPCAGSSARVLQDLASKTAVKERLRQAGLPTPDWIDATHIATADDPAGRWIVKPVWEHASRTMAADAVVEAADAAGLRRILAARREATGSEHFAERFVDGREFNLSILGGGGDGPTVLPPAEIDFAAYPEHMPRIVDYRAKWVVDSFEYANTPRCFDFAEGDADLLAEMSQICRLVWTLLGVRGWARVDFRVDGGNRPWVLEVNPNPCIAPDAGFVAASERAGLKPAEVVGAILDDALRGM